MRRRKRRARRAFVLSEGRFVLNTQTHTELVDAIGAVYWIADAGERAAMMSMMFQIGGARCASSRSTSCAPKSRGGPDGDK